MFHWLDSKNKRVQLRWTKILRFTKSWIQLLSLDVIGSGNLIIFTTTLWVFECFIQCDMMMKICILFGYNRWCLLICDLSEDLNRFKRNVDVKMIPEVSLNLSSTWIYFPSLSLRFSRIILYHVHKYFVLSHCLGAWWWYFQGAVCTMS